MKHSDLQKVTNEINAIRKRIAELESKANADEIQALKNAHEGEKECLDRLTIELEKQLPIAEENSHE